MWQEITPVRGGKDDKVNRGKCNTFVTLGRRYAVMFPPFLQVFYKFEIKKKLKLLQKAINNMLKREHKKFDHFTRALESMKYNHCIMNSIDRLNNRLVTVEEKIN